MGGVGSCNGGSEHTDTPSDEHVVPPVSHTANGIEACFAGGGPIRFNVDGGANATKPWATDVDMLELVISAKDDVVGSCLPIGGALNRTSTGGFALNWNGVLPCASWSICCLDTGIP